MSNITLSLDDDLVSAGREYAKSQHLSLNALIRDILRKTVTLKSKHWVNECFELMDKAKANSKGKKITRESLYDV